MKRSVSHQLPLLTVKFLGTHCRLHRPGIPGKKKIIFTSLGIETHGHTVYTQTIIQSIAAYSFKLGQRQINFFSACTRNSTTSLQIDHIDDCMVDLMKHFKLFVNKLKQSCLQFASVSMDFLNCFD